MKTRVYMYAKILSLWRNQKPPNLA